MSDKALVGWKGRGEEAGGSHEAHLIRKERAVVGLLHVQLHVCGNRSKGDSGGGCERADQVRARGAACAQAMEKCACAWRKRRWRGNARCMTLQALVRAITGTTRSFPAPNHTYMHIAAAPSLHAAATRT